MAGKPDWNVYVPCKQGAGKDRWMRAGAAWNKRGAISVKLDLVPTAPWDGNMMLHPADETKETEAYE